MSRGFWPSGSAISDNNVIFSPFFSYHFLQGFVHVLLPLAFSGALFYPVGRPRPQAVLCGLLWLSPLFQFVLRIFLRISIGAGCFSMKVFG